MDKGAFQTSREIFYNPIWQNIVEFRLFFLIYGKAMFSDEGSQQGDVRIGKGQWLRSYRNLQADLEYIENRSVKRYSLSRIKRAVDGLIKDERIKIEHTELGTLFTVLNYAKYQGLENYKRHNENAERTERERRENGDGTEMERRWNNNKNDKNDKECIKDIHSRNSNDDKPKSKPKKGSPYAKGTIEECKSIWEIYPKKDGRKKAFEKLPNLIAQYGVEHMIRTVERYIKAVEAERQNGFNRQYKIGSTFFNGGYEDYLDGNYDPMALKPNQPTSRDRIATINF